MPETLDMERVSISKEGSGVILFFFFYVRTFINDLFTFFVVSGLKILNLTSFGY
jgi:hypothetical protein